jgi:SAM-dependent methyltransferase
MSDLPANQLVAWDRRYDRADFFYGTEPNDFLREQVAHLPTGPVLCLGEGEGRNAVFLAQRGHAVTAVDLSPVGLAKAARLAAARGVWLTTTVADLAQYDLGTDRWAGMVSIWCHLPVALRRRVHGGIVTALRPGGVLLLEAYTPRQLQFGTGGPPVREYLMTLAELREEFAGLEFLLAQECDREVQEGSGHRGPSAVVQVVARKPAAPR